jgi:hypothetical protein
MIGLFFLSRGQSSRLAATRAGVCFSGHSGAGNSRFACGPP